MNCFPMLSEVYAAALLVPEDEGRASEKRSVPVSEVFPEEISGASVPDEDMETAPTRSLRLDTLHL